MKSKLQVKQAVLNICPDAYCCRLNDGTGYIVWPGRIQPRGSERAAIGLGRSSLKAWVEALITLNVTDQSEN